MRRSACLLALALLVVPAAGAATPRRPSLHFTVFAQTDLPLGQVAWTGREWLYVAENLGRIEVADASGAGARPFAAFDQGGEEMRCAVPPNGLWPDGVYCHTPDNRIVRLDRDGSNLVQVATLPGAGGSDGALAFDDVGRFGYALLAATGGSSSDGGALFAVRKDGRVQQIATYPGPGGADNLAIAAASFGPAAGSALLSIDQDSVSGRLLAVDRQGTVRTLAAVLGTGANPLAVVAPPPSPRPPGPPPGLYLADTNSEAVWFAPASELAAFTGSVVVGSELGGKLWLVRPRGRGFQLLAVTTDLPQRNWNFEASTYVP